MATDIFSRSVGYGGVFSADGAVMTFNGFAAGMLAQNVSWQYAQNITRLYELSSSNVWLVAGRTQGQAGLARVMGPNAMQVLFYQTYGNVCNAANNTLRFTGAVGCGNNAQAAAVAITMNNCVIQSYGGSVQAQDMIINEQLGIMFLSLLFA